MARPPSLTETYRRVSEPHFFSAPARDLVSLLHLGPGQRFLDVGCGTGPGASAAAALVGSEGMVVGIDTSLSMLRCALGAGRGPMVFGQVMTLPYPDSAFDSLAAGFVLHHISGYGEALNEMIRVLRDSGYLGVTSWATRPSDNKIGQLWFRVAGEFVPAHEMQEATKSILPWSDHFEDLSNLEIALTEAGLVNVESVRLNYRVVIDVADYVESRSIAAEASYMKEVLSSDDWERFQAMALERIKAQFGSKLDFATKVNFSVGANG